MSMPKRVLIWIAPLLLAAPGLGAGEVDASVAKAAAIVGQMHKKAKKALVNAAQDRAYGELATAADGGEAQAARQRVDAISLQVQERFQVEEMCLIHSSGAELARIVGRQVADDLSADESAAVFFAPGFEQRPRTVHVSPLYMSVDADKWVIAYVTPVLSDGQVSAILHYEHGLDAYQAALGRIAAETDQFLLAVDEAGWVVADTRRTIPVVKQGEAESPADYFQRFDFGGLDLAAVMAAVDGKQPLHDGSGRSYRASYKKVEGWTILGFQG